MSWLDSVVHIGTFSGKEADLYKDIVLSLAAMSQSLTSLLWSSLVHLKQNHYIRT